MSRVRVLWFGHSRCCLFELLRVNQCVVRLVIRFFYPSILRVFGSGSSSSQKWHSHYRSVVWGKIIFLLFFSLSAFIVWINVIVVYGEIIAQFINVSKLYYICCALSVAVEYIPIICGCNLIWRILKIDGFIFK